MYSLQTIENQSIIPNTIYEVSITLKPKLDKNITKKTTKDIKWKMMDILKSFYELQPTEH